MDQRARDAHNEKAPVTQSRLTRAIAKEFFLSQTDTGAIIDSILVRIAGSLREGERVYLKDFGSFTKKIRLGRHVRHPKTGQIIWIPPRPDVDFNPAKGLLKTLGAIKKSKRR